MDLQISTPHNFGPPKKIEIQKFWTDEKVVEILAFRYCMKFLLIALHMRLP